MATQFAATEAVQEQEVEQNDGDLDKNLEQPSVSDTLYGEGDQSLDPAEPTDDDLAEIDAEGEAEEPIAPPASWNAEDRAEWDQLPRKAQETILRRFGEMERGASTKFREAADAQKRVEQEAFGQLAQIQRNYAAELERYATMFMPQQPDPRLLYTGNQNDALTYQQQEAAYRQATAHQQQLKQEAEARAAEAQRIEEQQAQAQRQADAVELQRVLPDWFDTTRGPELQNRLQSIGTELGYPVELMAQATAKDILALSKAAEWKAKAEKFDKWMSRKMSAVAKAKQLPKIARPGAGGGQQATNDPVKLLYPND